MLKWIENNRDTDVYLSLRKAVNWKELSREQAEKALKNSMYILSAYENDEPIGMGRIVGDGAVICYVQDLIVIPEKQSDGIGGMILNRLKKFVASEGIPGTTMMFDLMCAKGRENFYEKHGFMARPTEDLGPGMIQYIKMKG